MKKIIAVSLLTLSLSSNAFWGNNNGYHNDNGIFGFNQYSFFDPRWYFEEAGNMMDEFDNNGYQQYGNYYQPHRYGYPKIIHRTSKNPKDYMMTPYGPGLLPK